MEPVSLSDIEDEGDWEDIGANANMLPQDHPFDPRASEDGDFSGAESDEDYTAHGQGDAPPAKKKGSYDSRIEQILYENPDLPILITDAGRSTESGGKYIVYTIRTKACIADGKACYLADWISGSRSAAKVFGVRVTPGCLNQTTSYSDHSTDSREAHHGGLRCKPYEGEARPVYY
jgi:hypothetical protein